MRITTNTPAVLRATFTTADEETPLTLDGPPTVTVAGLVCEPLTLTAVEGDAPGSWTAPLPPLAEVDELTVTWSGEVDGVRVATVTEVSVADRHYFTIAELRKAEGKLADPVKYPTTRLAELRETFEAIAEGFCLQNSFVARARHQRVRLAGNGMASLRTPYTLRLIRSSVPGVTLVSGVVCGPPNAVVDVVYAAGYSAAPPADLKESAMSTVRTWALEQKSPMGGREVSITTEVGNVQLATAGQRRPIGIPAVDGVLLRLRETVAIAVVA